MIQEHKLDKKGAKQAQDFCEARGIAARFSCREDEAAREGTAILIKTKPLAISHEDVTFDKCADGRCTVAAFTTKGRKETIASIYLPTVPSERAATIRDIRTSNVLAHVTVLGADHNCVPEPALDAYVGYENAHANVWESYLTSLGLSDISRTQNGPTRGPFTRMPTTGSFTRIDRILAKEDANTQHTAGIDEGFGFSKSRTAPDHKTVTISRKYLTKDDRGKDVTRINVDLLNEQNIRDKIRDIYTHVYNSYNTDAWGHAPVWGLFKEKVKTFLVRESRNRNRASSREIDTATNLLRLWSIKATKDGMSDQHAQIRQALRTRLIKAKESHKPRSRKAAYKRLLFEEKSTKEMFRSLKAPHSSQWIDSLKKVNDWNDPPAAGSDAFERTADTNDAQESLQCATHYYSWLFSEKPSSPDDAAHYITLLEQRTLSVEARNSLEGHVTIKETYKSMSSLANGKSPGPDALPNEFYKWFAGTLAGTLTKVLNEAFDNESLPECLKTGNISLLYKKKDRRDMRNYRPITLLNSDYKVLTRILCWRMKRVMHEIVSPENTGFSPGRFIAENSILTKLIQAYLDEEELPGALIFLDFEKAFDRVSWEFMHKAFRALGFGPDFRKFIRMLYDNSNPQKRRININGHTGPYFPLGSGVAQGCPLSPLIYLCVAEGLTRAINMNPNIHGITIGDLEQKISQFADDTMLTLSDTEHSWNATTTEMERYSRAAGAKLNIDKTEAILAGTLRRNPTPVPPEWKVCPDGQYIISLGVPIGNDFDEDAFWSSKYFKCKSILANWKNLFVHSIKGRVLISQASVYSRFRYWLNSMMPSVKINEFIRKDLRELLWSSHPEFNPNEGGTNHPCAPPFLKKTAAQLRWGEGGVGILNWTHHCRAFRIHWIIRYLDPTRGNWKKFIDYWIDKNHPEGRHIVLNRKIAGKDLFPNHRLLSFFRDAVDGFAELEWEPQPPPTSRENMLSLPLWHNPLINTFMFDDTTISALIEMRFYTVTDLWDDQAHSPWTAHEVHAGFTTDHNHRAGSLQRRLGEVNKFTDEWNSFIRHIPTQWWRLLTHPDYQIAEGEHFAYYDGDTLHYALYQDADLNCMIPCEITTKGSLHELEDILDIPDDTFGMKILYDHKRRVVGPEERAFPRWHEWNLKLLAQRPRASRVKINHIYRALISSECERPNCEEKWEKFIDPPHDGWDSVWRDITGLMGTPRDIKTRFKFLHRGLWTQHKLSIVASIKHSQISDRCILCGRHQGTHKHFVECNSLDRSFEWLKAFGALLHITLHMTTEDKVYGTMNGGERMPKGMRLFYSLLFKFWWLGYTTQNNTGETFIAKTAWLSATRRLRMIIHAYEIETQKRLDQIDRTMHHILGTHPRKKDKAIEHELKRRNEKLEPLGELTIEEGELNLTTNFRWADLTHIPDNN